MKIDVEKATRQIHRRILADVRDRRGWKQEYDGFRDEVKNEIAEAWKGIIRFELLLADGTIAKWRHQRRRVKP